MAAILLPPFTHPAAFWAALWRPHNLYFPLFVLLPVLGAAVVRPVHLLAGGVTCLFIGTVVTFSGEIGYIQTSAKR